VTREKINKQLENASIKFLDSDFNQCFQQLRYYDGQIIEIVKYSFFIYSGLLGLSLTLFKIEVENNKDYSFSIVAMLIAGFVMGVYLFILVTRNRAYFVLVTRYINEYREFFLKRKPLGFKNNVGMYTNFSYPLYFNWLSSHSWFLYLMATLNSVFAAALIYMAVQKGYLLYLCIFEKYYFTFFLTFFIQLGWAIIFLNSKEKRPTSKGNLFRKK
jgi:hypothetical protein